MPRMSENVLDDRFPNAMVNVGGNFYVILENGDVMFNAMEAGEYLVTYADLRELSRLADRFKFMRERRVE